MAAGNPQQSLRKALGVLKDSTKVGLVNLNSDNKWLDIAIVKATNHDEVLPKEKHIKTILDAVSASKPLADVAYCIQGLAKRLAKTRNWTVVGESVNLYVAITDGILILVEKYFQMQGHYAIRTLEIYKKAGNQAESLSELFEICRELDFGRGQKYIKIKQPPASFLAAMEDYVKDAPTSLVFQSTAVSADRCIPLKEAPKVVAIPETDLLTKKQDAIVAAKPYLRDNILMQCSNAGWRVGQIDYNDAIAIATTRGGE
ncbi:hypothetical protein LWI28_010368 [Acer negundo]|uniref:ENTH domain-containing protein n=1 Tax=Acer negundo TaxID=4023 RepID=A0AAD5P0F1_ACENE|nr:hypothetical protein LWI28_010368 [Acer negundo]